MLEEYDNVFSYEIYNVTKDDFDDYKEQCSQKGFVKNSSDSDEEYYVAENSDGIQLDISYDSDSNRMTCTVLKK